MKVTRRLLPIAALLIGALALSACLGGGDDPSRAEAELLASTMLRCLAFLNDDKGCPADFTSFFASQVQINGQTKSQTDIGNELASWQGLGYGDIRNRGSSHNEFQVHIWETSSWAGSNTVNVTGHMDVDILRDGDTFKRSNQSFQVLVTRQSGSWLIFQVTFPLWGPWEPNNAL